MPSPKINQRLNGQNPLAYMGVDAGQPTDLVTKPRDPTTSDYQGYQLGCWWLNIATNDMWYLVNLNSRVATWLKIGGTASLLTLTGDTGGAITGDTLKNINLISGFSSFSVDGNPGTNTLTLNSNGTIGVSYHTDSGNATPSANILNIVGGLNINTVGSGNTVTIKTPQLAEGVVYANGSGVFTSLSKGTNGQILIGQTGSTPAWNNITSADGSVTITDGPNSINLEVPSGPTGITSGFSAFKSATTNNVTGDGTQYFYIANTKVFDIGGSDYDAVSGIFTAPSAGYYFFGAFCCIQGGPASVFTCPFIIALVTSGGTTYQIYRHEAENEIAPSIGGATTIVSLSMHETVRPYLIVSGTTKVIDLVGSANPIKTTFFGYRLPT